MIKFLKFPIQSGTSPSKFPDSKSSLSLVKCRNCYGNLVNLFLERSINVSSIKLLKLSGKFSNLLLSDYSLFNRTNCPKSLGNSLIALFLIFNPFNFFKPQSYTGKDTRSLFLKFSFSICSNFEMVSMLLILFLLSCNR